MARDTDPTTPLSEEASHWWEVLHGEGASATDHREFGEWVVRSPERVEAYLRTALLLQTLKSREVRWPTTPAEQLIREAKAAPQEALPFSRRTTRSVGQDRAARRSPRTLFAVGLAAALLIGIGSAWVRLMSPQQFQTRFGEQRSFLLEDGSRITLNTASKIEVQLRKAHRVVRLVEGEALFDVAHDANRPFDVNTGNAMLRAVGTQFDVDVRPSRTTVTVVEGRVALVSGVESGSAGGELPILAAADRLTIPRTGPGVLQHGTNVAAATSWTQRRLVFEHRPLGEVAEEFNRYNRDRIEIASEALRSQEVTGVFQSNDAASFVSFLSSIPGVQIREDASGAHIVTLHNRGGGQ